MTYAVTVTAWASDAGTALAMNGFMVQDLGPEKESAVAMASGLATATATATATQTDLERVDMAEEFHSINDS